MRYFVIGTDNQRYGPADVEQLTQWISQGRIDRSTLLIDAQSNQQLTAGSVDSLQSALRESDATVEHVVAVEDLDGPNARAMPPRRGPNKLNNAPLAEPVGPKSKIVAGLLGIFFGAFGFHRFYLGYIGVGLVQLVLTIMTSGIALIWGLTEGIICLAGGMTDAQGRRLRG